MRKIIIISCSIFFATYLNAKTIAISYFDNSSGDAKYNALSKGIADMLITDLSKVKGITIVEREKLEKLVQEIKLEQSKYFDQATAQKLGKGLGAQNILTGSFYLLENTIRIDARLIDVQTGGIIVAEQVTGNKNNFFALYQQLANLLTKNLNVPYSPQLSNLYNPKEEVSLTAVVNYSNAIEFQDVGMNSDAKQLLEKTVMKNPTFNFAKNKLDDLKEWLKKAEQEREHIVTEELKSTINSLNAADPNFGTQLNTIWSTLLTSYKHNQLISFNNSLRKMNLDEKKKLYGDASPITLGEMLLFYDCTAYASLKKYDEQINSAKAFITSHPTSMYFQSVKLNLEQAIKELETREKGKQNIDSKLSAVGLDAYVNYLDKLKWKSNLQFVDKKEYNRYLQLYKTHVLSVSEETLAAWDESSKLNTFIEFSEIAFHFEDTKTIEEIISVSKKLFSEDEAQDKLLKLEEKLVDLKNDLKKEEEKINQLEIVSKKGTKEELEKSIKAFYNYEKYNKEDLLLMICEKYISNFKPTSNEEVELTLKAWDASLKYTAQIKGIDDAKKVFESFKSKATDFKTSQVAYDKTLKEMNLDLKSLQKNYSEYLNNLKNYESMIDVLEKYAQVYNENHQYTEEAYTRKQLLDLFKLDPEKEAMQLYMLALSYYNQGYFENTKKTAAVLKEKHPSSGFSETITPIINFIPQ